MSKRINEKNICFFVVSVIQPHSSIPFTYGCRSYFSPEERKLQTINTIQSIKKYFPKADIIFIEGGGAFDRDIKNSVKKYLYLGKYNFCKRAVNNVSKAWGELVLTLCTIFTWLKYDYTFKISGRYWLNGNVDYQIFTANSKRVTGYDIYGDHTQISTRLLGIPKSCYIRYLYALLRRFWRVPNSNTVYEAYILQGLSNNNVNFIPKIGVSGFTGVTSELIDE
jgi:hypothetical protein